MDVECCPHGVPDLTLPGWAVSSVVEACQACLSERDQHVPVFFFFPLSLGYAGPCRTLGTYVHTEQRPRPTVLPQRGDASSR